MKNMKGKVAKGGQRDNEQTTTACIQGLETNCFAIWARHSKLTGAHKPTH